MDRSGRPVAYWLANPGDQFMATQVADGYPLDASYYARVAAKVGHRPGAFHSFLPKEPEQVRGVSVLAPAMKFFKDLSDYLDYELVGAIVASSIPVFIETQNPAEQYNNIRVSTDPNGDEEEEKTYHQEVEPGQFLYGNTGEKPHVLKNDRPGNTFESFVERVLRAVGASVGMPYEVIAKDFSKTNYSSARAALLEAHRVYQVYQKWLVDGFCQPVWEMVLEEAYLRGMIPSLAGMDVDTFYRQLPALAKARWIPPRRGHVDPLKEMNANLKGLENNVYTLSDIAAEHGTDWRSLLEQRAKELAFEREQQLRTSEEE
jgi:lambda family phage portal protein